MEKLVIGGTSFSSRLLLGTGKFSSASVMANAIKASGAGIITAALRRVDFDNPDDVFLNVIHPDDYVFLTNTSGARTAERCHSIGLIWSNSITLGKIELTPEPNHLLPDPIETLKAAEVLVNEGMIVLPYINADPVVCKRLEDVGCHAVILPLGAPIGTNKGLTTRDQLSLLLKTRMCQ